jgi:ribonuclease BN (tRNA processing enzyme)
MQITVLGGGGAWPGRGRPCSGYLVEHEDFTLLVDPGYATFSALLEHTTAAAIGAVYVTHGHPDHCIDLNPLLRARVLSEQGLPPLPVYAPGGALDVVLALDRPGMLASGYTLHELDGGGPLRLGPFAAETRLLPHMVPNLGLRLEADGRTLAYTGDTGPSPEVGRLAEGADLLLAEATYADEVPADSREHLSSAAVAGDHAAAAGARRLLLVHLQPGTDPEAASAAARRRCEAEVLVAEPGLQLQV